MKIYDISQEVFSCEVYPGDPSPRREVLCDMEKGDAINLTALSMCAHNGTHVDAPAHFIKNGMTVERLSLEKTVGAAFVCEKEGTVTAEDARNILAAANGTDPEAARRILIKGRAVLSADAARVFAEAEIELFGNESQTVGAGDDSAAVHGILLGAQVVLLEGIRLREVPDGAYLLSAAPLALAGAEGAPCRAILIKL